MTSSIPASAAMARAVRSLSPVIIQTSGGTAYKGPAPSVKLLIELAHESPYFGYVKEETSPIVTRMKELVAAKPTIKRVFSAMGGFGWLYQAARRLGGADHRTCGLCGRSGPHLGVDAKVVVESVDDASSGE